MVNIEWNWNHLPTNRDEVTPLAIQKFEDGTEVALFYNHSKQRFLFEYEGNYGILAQESR